MKSAESCGRSFPSPIRLADATGLIRSTSNEKRVAEDRRGCYWLYVMANCATAPVWYGQRKALATIDRREVASVALYCVTKAVLKRPEDFGEGPQAPFAGAP